VPDDAQVRQYFGVDCEEPEYEQSYEDDTNVLSNETLICDENKKTTAF
jgi:hypothetical protein